MIHVNPLARAPEALLPFEDMEDPVLAIASIENVG
jgi:hypothetical protein